MEIEKVLKELGWTQDDAQPMYWDKLTASRGGSFPMTIALNSEMETLFDKIYSIGFKDGLERGAYEQQTQEDAETPTSPPPRVSLDELVSLKNQYDCLKEQLEFIEADELKFKLPTSAFFGYKEDVKQFLIERHTKDILEIEKRFSALGIALED